MPGVPYEMKTICRTARPEARQDLPFGRGISQDNDTTGMAESVLAATIERWETDLHEGFKLAYLPNPNGVRLRLSSYTLGKEEAEHVPWRHFAN